MWLPLLNEQRHGVPLGPSEAVPLLARVYPTDTRRRYRGEAVVWLRTHARAAARLGTGTRLSDSASSVATARGFRDRPRVARGPEYGCKPDNRAGARRGESRGSSGIPRR